jgi:hypothetical protein
LVSRAHFVDILVKDSFNHAGRLLLLPENEPDADDQQGDQGSESEGKTSGYAECRVELHGVSPRGPLFVPANYSGKLTWIYGTQWPTRAIGIEVRSPLAVARTDAVFGIKHMPGVEVRCNIDLQRLMEKRFLI